LREILEAFAIDKPAATPYFSSQNVTTTKLIARGNFS
jgi:hypothetical protein